MKPDLPHILIAEPEFLIALDAEYLIKAALECRITLQRPEQVDHWDSTALADVDLCLLDVPGETAETLARIRRLVENGVPLLLTTISEIQREGVVGFEVVPVVTKPFEAETLAALVKARLRPRPQPLETTDQN
jgi:DNA-binding response OmpR family regulator